MCTQRVIQALMGFVISIRELISIYMSIKNESLCRVKDLTNREMRKYYAVYANIGDDGKLSTYHAVNRRKYLADKHAD